MEQSIEKLKKYMDESYIRVDRDLHSMSASNYLMPDAYIADPNSVSELIRRVRLDGRCLR